MDFTKLKVPELKRELKTRGLSATGNKNELIERLQTSLSTSSSTGHDSIDDLDEALLNEDDELFSTSTTIVKPTVPASPPKLAFKRKIDNVQLTTLATPPIKKLILNRNPNVENVIEDIPNTTPTPPPPQNPITVQSPIPNNTNEKKLVKIGNISAKERMEMRSKKFSAPTGTGFDAKKEARAQRFGISSTAPNSDPSKATDQLDVLKKRAERFGGSVSKVMSTMDEAVRLEKRKQRFGTADSTISTVGKVSTTTMANTQQNQRMQNRLKRFQQTVI